MIRWLLRRRPHKIAIPRDEYRLAKTIEFLVHVSALLRGAAAVHKIYAATKGDEK